jgi:predicted transcriptional regulator
MDIISTPRDLRSTRERLGLSRRDLASRAGLHETTIMRIEGGQDPRTVKAWLPIVAALNAISAESPMPASAPKSTLNTLHHAGTDKS